VKTFTKEQLIAEIKSISEMGWIHNAHRRGNSGAIGNTLEDLLGIKENNLPIPNASEWELKVSTIKSNITLCHVEPSPRACRLVPQVLLPRYGWSHKQAGLDRVAGELSFRQTINAMKHSSRGFIVRVNDEEQKIEVSFDYLKVKPKEADWLVSVEARAGLGEVNPQPYWGFKDLERGEKGIGTKLANLFHVVAQKKKIDEEEYFRYDHLFILKNFNFLKFLDLMRRGFVKVDLDASTSHNHGTKFRIKHSLFHLLYDETLSIF